MNGAWSPGEKQRTRATFLSSKALDCAVPSLSNTAVSTEDFMMNDKPYARWEIKVTSPTSPICSFCVGVFFNSLWPFPASCCRSPTTARSTASPRC